MKDLNALDLGSLYAELTRPGVLRRLLELARDEDLGGAGDVTSAACIPESSTVSAALVAREEGVVAGLRALPELIDVFAPSCEQRTQAADGDTVSAGGVLATIDGPTRQVLALERTLLNLLSRLSGVATNTARYASTVSGTRAEIFDTRKTTPGLRAMEKYAVRCGGGFCHRLGLHDAVLIKDNHLAGVGLDDFARFVADAAARARAVVRSQSEQRVGSGGGVRFVQVEVDSLDQLRALLDAGGAGTDSVLLDNFAIEDLRRAVSMRDDAGVDVALEASGGVTLETVRLIAETGVDRISVGALTHHAVWLDLALDVTAER